MNTDDRFCPKRTALAADEHTAEGSLTALDQYFDRIREQEQRSDAIDRGIRALKILGDLDVPAARPFQLALAAVHNAYSYCSSPARDSRLLTLGRGALDLADQHLKQAGDLAEPGGSHELYLLLKDAHDALRTHYSRLDRPVEQIGRHTDLRVLAGKLLVMAAGAATELCRSL